MAHRQLTQMGVLVMSALEWAQDNHADAEVRRRCWSLLDPFAEQIADRDSQKLLPHGFKVHPWAHNIYSTWGPRLWAEESQKEYANRPPNYLASREATRM